LTRADIEQALGITRMTAQRLLADLQNQGLLILTTQTARSRQTRYRAATAAAPSVGDHAHVEDSVHDHEHDRVHDPSGP
jgi:DNA-binding transcriptional regulator LsrR (DeoR family)